MINTSDLTTLSLEGTGAFDVLMRAVELHLQNEYTSNRITGNDYATAYIQLMAAAMQVAASYAVSKPTEEAKVAEMTATLPYTLQLAESSVSKSDQESSLLFAKVQTEKANVCDQVQCEITGSAVPVLGVIGKQKTLYQNQAEGFVHDHLTKVAKIYADVAAVQLSSNDVYSTAGTGLEDVNIRTVLDRLKNSTV